MAIYFYKIKDEYGCFSNFAHYGFELDGKWWMTSEHYFQAQKFCGTEYEETIVSASKQHVPYILSLWDSFVNLIGLWLL